jgi:hypothetical protein
MVEELAPVGTLQTVLARRVAVAAWRLARADRLAAETGLGPRSQPGGQQTELFEERRSANGGLGLALIRDGNGARARSRRLAGASSDLGGRCAPTNRYRGAAMAEFWRALRTLKALQAEQAAMAAQVAACSQSRRGSRRGAPHCRLPRLRSPTNPSVAWPDRNTS